MHHRGTYYTITGLEGTPAPVQRPHPPIFVGGGGKRLLSFAAREATIVGIAPRALPGGGMDWAGSTEAVLAEKVGWVREAAGDRFARLELALLVFAAAVTDRPREAAERVARDFGLTAEQALAAPDYLIGSVEQIVERLRGLRDRHGISYVSVFPEDMEAFAPVVVRLAGT